MVIHFLSYTAVLIFKGNSADDGGQTKRSMVLSHSFHNKSFHESAI